MPIRTKREQIPDPNAVETFTASIPKPVETDRFDFYQRLIALANEGNRAAACRARCHLGAEVIGPKAVLARWRLGDGSRLTIVTNLGADAVQFDTPAGRLLFATGDTGPMTAAYLEVAA